MKMNKKLAISITCGELTCASEPGKFCRFSGTRRFGTEFVCMLFPSEDSFTHLVIKNGWAQRCNACLASQTN